jgi:hypothetical protein
MTTRMCTHREGVYGSWNDDQTRCKVYPVDIAMQKKHGNIIFESSNRGIESHWEL